MNNKIKILIGCEYSGTVREEFNKLGFDAWSCDILPTDQPGNHIQDDIFNIVNNNWDLFICFPPCTYLSSAGLYLCDIKQYGKKAIERIKKRNMAINFFLDLYSLPIKYMCLENPLGHISANILKPSQIIHPYYFGEPHLKRTALWLKNLPNLEYRLIDDLFGSSTAIKKPDPTQTTICKKTGKIKNRYFTDSIVNNTIKTAHTRNKTFVSIAQAMAQQWGEFIINEKTGSAYKDAAG